MNDFFATVSFFSMIACFITSMIISFFVYYYLYKYLLEKEIVCGGWDYIGYIWGAKNAKKYKIILDKTVNHHPYLQKARKFLYLYWGLMIMVIVMLFSGLWFSG